MNIIKLYNIYFIYHTHTRKYYYLYMWYMMLIKHIFKLLYCLTYKHLHNTIYYAILKSINSLISRP